MDLGLPTLPIPLTGVKKVSFLVNIISADIEYWEIDEWFGFGVLVVLGAYGEFYAVFHCSQLPHYSLKEGS